VAQRAMTMLGGAQSEARSHPLDPLAGLLTAPRGLCSTAGVASAEFLRSSSVHRTTCPSVSASSTTLPPALTTVAMPDSRSHIAMMEGSSTSVMTRACGIAPSRVSPRTPTPPLPTSQARTKTPGLICDTTPFFSRRRLATRDCPAASTNPPRSARWVTTRRCSPSHSCRIASVGKRLLPSSSRMSQAETQSAVAQASHSPSTSRLTTALFVAGAIVPVWQRT